MKTHLLSIVEQDQVRRAMSYWVANWDWECPTLFGIELHELKVVLDSWPDTSTPAETEALAAIGSLRELLHGAATAPRSQLPELLGINYETASALCNRVHTIYSKRAQL
jgi:hypothetical protein